MQSLFKCLKAVGKETRIFESAFRDNAGLAPLKLKVTLECFLKILSPMMTSVNKLFRILNGMFLCHSVLYYRPFHRARLS